MNEWLFVLLFPMRANDGNCIISNQSVHFPSICNIDNSYCFALLNYTRVRVCRLRVWACVVCARVRVSFARVCVCRLRAWACVVCARVRVACARMRVSFARACVTQCVYRCLCARVCVRARVFVRACLHVYVRACVRARVGMSVYAHACTSVCARPRACLCACVCVRTRVCVCLFACFFKWKRDISYIKQILVKIKNKNTNLITKVEIISVIIQLKYQSVEKFLCMRFTKILCICSTLNKYDLYNVKILVPLLL